MKTYLEFLMETPIAYHGSRYDFDKFDIGEVGSGEGETGFGYGLYFSVDKDDAKGYAEKLEQERGEARLYKVKLPDDKYFLNLDVYIDKQNDYIMECLIKLKNYPKLLNRLVGEEVEKEIDRILNSVDYTDEEKIELTQDIKTLSEQEYEYMLDRSTGSDVLYYMKYKIYDNNDNSEESASTLLNKLGLKGTSHSGYGMKHYIVFDDSDIKVVSKTKPRFS